MNALTLYRLGHWCYRRRIPVLPRVASWLITFFCQATIPMSAEIGEGVVLARNGLGVVLHERCRIGRGVTIGDRVTIGPVSVGAQCVVKSEAVVMDDVPAHSLVPGAARGAASHDAAVCDLNRLLHSDQAERDSFCSSDDVIVTVIKEPSRLTGLMDEWHGLLKDSDADCLFLTQEWLATWWEHFRRHRRLALVTLRRQGRLLGLAPFYLHTKTFGGVLPHRAMDFLATGVVGSDYLDVVMRRGYEKDVSRGLAEYFQRQQPVVTLSHVNQARHAARGVVTGLKEAGWTVHRSVIETCPYVTLRGHTWESYLASLGSSHRYNFHRRLKNLHKQGTLVFDLVEKEDQRREALQMLLELHNRCWDGRGGSDAMQTPQELAFHDAFSRLALERGWLRLFVLRLEGRPLGALYGFRYGRRFYFYQSGFDPAYRQQSVGMVTMGLAIQHAIMEGAEEYDFLHGTESYKFLWTSESRDLERIRLFPPSSGGLLCRAALQGEDVAKRVARRVLPAPVLAKAIAERRRPAA